MQAHEDWVHGLGNQVIIEMLELARKKKWYKILGGYVLETNTASRAMAERSGIASPV